MSRRDTAGRTTRFEYSADGQVTKVRRESGAVTTFDFDDTGRRAAMVDALGRTTYEYGPSGFPTAVEFSNGARLKYDFDWRGRRRRVEVDGSWWMAYEYDPWDRLTAIESPLGKVVYSYRYENSPGPKTLAVRQRTLPNGVVTTWNWDSRRQLISLRHRSKDAELAGWEYEYDDEGRIAKIHSGGAATRYAYDSLGRLASVEREGKVVERYRYDRGTNLIEWEIAGRKQNATPGAWGELERLDDETRRYDELGQLIATAADRGQREFRWDEDGRLVAVRGGKAPIDLHYDGDGNLVRRVTGEGRKDLIYDVSAPLPQLLALRDGDGHVSDRFLLGPSRLAHVDASGDATWFLEDHLQSIRATVDSEGRVTRRFAYTSFGRPALDSPDGGGVPVNSTRATDASLSSPLGDFGFAGEWREPATGLVYLRARWYEPETGRFLSPDPNVGNPRDPAAMHRYTYAAADPVNRCDPAGLFPPPFMYRPWAQEEFRHIARMADSVRVFPSAANPAGFIRAPDFYEASADFSRTLSAPGGIIGGGIGIQASVTLDRFGRWHAEIPDVHVGVETRRHIGVESPVNAGAFYILQWTPPTRAQLFAATREEADFALHVGHLEYRRVAGMNVAGLVVAPSIAADTSHALGVSPRIIAALQNMDAAAVKRRHEAEVHQLYTAAAALAKNDYRYPSREHVENKLAAYYEALAHASPYRREQAFVDWIMDAHYSSPEQAARGAVVNAGLLAPTPAAMRGWVGGGAMQPPRVGGVYLAPLNELLVRMGPLQGARFDTEQGRLMLIGGDSSATTTRLDASDLAVVARCLSEGRFPGFSIDPVPTDPTGPVMNCRYIGPIESTGVGLVMFQADRLMKDLGVGQDQTGNPLRPKTSGFADQFELARRFGGRTDLWNRFWLTPGKIEWVRSPDGATLWCRRAEVQVKTETMRNVGGKLVPAQGVSDPAAAAFAESLTRDYDSLADEFPAFARLRELVRLVGIVTWLKGQLPSEQFETLTTQLADQRREVATPVTTPAARVERQFETGGGGIRTWQIYGGVDLKLAAIAPVESEKLAELSNALRRAVPDANGKPRRIEVDSQGRRFTALDVPLIARRSLDSLRLQVSDLALPLDGAQMLELVRHYDSTHRESGPFGRGWTWLLPEFRLRGDDASPRGVLTDAW
ncbi:MAG TPA: RHS repeat-associated core domain-containing protein, partial [Pirellulaceae bacterium]|nr:RHS repeat-associated core domain-containing protein [Pirellulaceae bacterium]